MNIRVCLVLHDAFTPFSSISFLFFQFFLCIGFWKNSTILRWCSFQMNMVTISPDHQRACRHRDNSRLLGTPTWHDIIRIQTIRSSKGYLSKHFWASLLDRDLFLVLWFYDGNRCSNVCIFEWPSNSLSFYFCGTGAISHFVSSCNSPEHSDYNVVSDTLSQITRRITQPQAYDRAKSKSLFYGLFNHSLVQRPTWVALLRCRFRVLWNKLPQT